MTVDSERGVPIKLDSAVYLDLGEGPPVYAEVSSEDLPRILDHLDMKAEPMRNVQQFKLGDGFQAEYDAWKAQVEKEGRGVLDVTEREIILDGKYLLITWRVVPPCIAAKVGSLAGT